MLDYVTIPVLAISLAEVQELKSGGMAGTTAEDVKADPEVRKMLDSLNTYIGKSTKN